MLLSFSSAVLVLEVPEVLQVAEAPEAPEVLQVPESVDAPWRFLKLLRCLRFLRPRRRRSIPEGQGAGGRGQGGRG